jgi:23S rRNA (adenine2503-C2)-methyltransferase
MDMPPIDILSLTSGRFLEQAAARGIGALQALAVYRRTFRESDPRLAAWIALPQQPVISSRREDRTIKFTQRLEDGLETEAVILPRQGRTGRPRTSLCVSSQVGCALGCTFCQTGRMGLHRSLFASEIIAQFLAARRDFHAPVTNVVFMGMGEPLDNLSAVIDAVRVLADRNGPSIAPSRISISTAGRIAGIERLAGFVRQPGFHRLRLAVSLNAPNDEIRSRIMPINRAEPMARLMEALRRWPCRDRSRILIEYVLIPGVNDEPQHADELCAFLRPLRCTVNVVPYNPRLDSPWPAPGEEHVQRFVDRIIAKGQFVKQRRTMGRSVMGACGQLGNRRLRRAPLAGPGRALR